MLSCSCSWLLSAATQQLSLRWTLTPTSCPRCQGTEIWSLQMCVCVSKAEFWDVSLNQAGPQNLPTCVTMATTPNRISDHVVWVSEHQVVTVCRHLFQKQLKKQTFQDKNKILWILLSDFILDVQLTCRTGNAFLAVVVPVRLVCLGLAFGCWTEIEIIILPKIKMNLNFIKIVSGRKCCL